MKKKLIITCLIVSLIIIMVGISVYRQVMAKGPEVKTELSTHEKISEHLMIPGSVELDNQQKVFYSADKGRLKNILVKEGQKVTKGTALLQFEQPQLKVELEQSRLSIQSLSLRLAQINTNLNRLQDKEDELAKTIGRKNAEKQLETEITQLQTEKKIANIDIQQANLQKDSLERQINDLTIDSTIEGTVLELNEQVIGGEQVLNVPIIIVGQLGSLTAKGNITQYDSVKVKQGQNVTLRSDAIANREWIGKINTLSFLPKENAIEASNPEVAAQYDITVNFKDSTALLRPGFQLIMEIVTEEKEAITVPLEAIISKGDQEYVFVLRKNVAEKVVVKSGVTSGDKIEIVDGLEENQKVIINPPETLKDGMEVTVK